MNSAYSLSANGPLPKLYSFESKIKSKNVGFKYHSSGENYKVKSLNLQSKNSSGYVVYDINRKKNSEGEKMDNEKILEMYINKVDKDQSELKQDMRESEKRIEGHIRDSEKRMDDKLGRIENLIQSQDIKFDKMNESMSQLRNEVSDKLDDYRKFNWGIAISIWLSIAALIVSLIVTLLQLK